MNTKPLLSIALLLAFLAGGVFSSQVSASTTTTILASEDTYIDSSKPTTNFGTILTTWVRGGTPTRRGLLRFSLSSIPSGAQITSATLKLSVSSDGSAVAGNLNEVTGAWSEKTVTYATAPQVGALVSSLPNPATPTGSVSVNITSYVAGKTSVSLYIVSASSDGVVYYTREKGSSLAPRLTIVWSTGVTGTAPATNTPIPTRTATRTAAPSNTATATTSTSTATRTPTATGAATATRTASPSASASPSATATVTGSISATPTETVVPPATATASPTATAATPPSDPVVMAAGDIICDSLTTTSAGCQQMAVSQIIVDQQPSAALVLGDLCHTPSVDCFNNYYGTSWGRAFSISNPVPGNHDYLAPGAQYYFDYWNGVGNVLGQAGDRSKGYYSYDLGTWHIIALNSNCGDIGGCNLGNAEYTWLQQDLQLHPAFCTLAYWHIPVFSSGGRASPNMQRAFTLLWNSNADIVLNGHDHIYERYVPIGPSGVPDPVRGVRQFIVGTGGANHTAIATVQPGSEVRNATTFGVLKLTLHPGSYDWRFIPAAGGTFSDSGYSTCH